jgi:hypothetical protein
MFTNKNNSISKYLSPLKLLVTKVSAEMGFCRLFSHISIYSEKKLQYGNFLT